MHGEIEPQFEFIVCFGTHLEEMVGNSREMAKWTRPKVVLMEAGGNNVNF
jgi:hypothetical protein